MRPNDCDSSFPTLFCSVFQSTSHETCRARLGSALICDDASVSGVLLNEGSCSIQDERAYLNYQSLHEFEEWIQQQFSKSGTLAKTSSLLISFAILLQFSRT
jgi:hypothetical protein